MPIHENPNRVSDPLGANELLKLMLDPAKYQQRLDELNQITQQASEADARAQEIIAKAKEEGVAIRTKALEDIAKNNDEFNSKMQQIKSEWERKALELDRREASLKAEEDEMAKQLASTKATEDEFWIARKHADQLIKDATEKGEQAQKRLEAINTGFANFISSVK